MLVLEKILKKVKKNSESYLSPYGQKLSFIFANSDEREMELMGEYSDYPSLRPYIYFTENSKGVYTKVSIKPEKIDAYNSEREKLGLKRINFPAPV